MTLSRLGRRQVEAMVERVTGGKALPPEMVEQIVAKTDGVPLFVEELTKTVLESVASIESVESIGSHDHRSLPAIAIPATLHDSLMARLDRLGRVKEVAQLGATLGREFSYELLQAVSLFDEERLQQGLKQLVEAELVYQRGLPPQAHYLFKHALIQDTAYQALLKSTRQQYHRQIAQVLKERFPETVETQPELVAHHYTEAGLSAQAIPYWRQAGKRATQRSAYVEAIAHLTKGLGLLKTLPDTPERVQQELRLHLTLGPPLQITKGYGAPEMEQTYSRALALCRQVGETPLLFSALAGLVEVYFHQREYHKARAQGEQLLHLAETVHDPALLMAGHNWLALPLYYLGELPAARAHFEQGLARHDPQQSFPSSVGPLLLQLAHVLRNLGYPDQALKRSHEAVALAEGLSHPFIRAYALVFTAWLHCLRGEERAAQEQAETAITLSREQGFPFWLGWATLVRGGALAAQGQGETGIRQIHQGLETLRAIRSEVGWTNALSWLARAYEQVGQAEAGLSVLAEALEVVHKTGERCSEAELVRLKGELTRQSQVSGPRATVAAEAEECFHQAIAIARRQSAKSWELRAVMSLSRLWQSQGKKAEARKLLAEIYGWFTEGFDTKDLQEAKAMIEKLSH